MRGRGGFKLTAIRAIGEKFAERFRRRRDRAVEPWSAKIPARPRARPTAGGYVGVGGDRVALKGSKRWRRRVTMAGAPRWRFKREDPGSLEAIAETMTNWRRHQWIGAGRPADLADVYADLVRPRRVAA